MAASEIALFSLSRFQLRYLKEHFRTTHRKIKRLLSDPGGLLVTILVVNEVVNIALTSLVTEVIARSQLPIPGRFSNMPRWAFEMILGTAITAPAILFLCEITPKAIGARINQLIATLNIGPLTVVYDIFGPIRYLLKQLIRIFVIQENITHPSKHPTEASRKQSPILRESDFLLMVEEGHKEGAIQESELELIKNVFELDNTIVADVSTPLSQVLSLTVDTTVKGALIAVRSQRYSRIPVLSTNRREVVGILYSKDLLKSKLEPQLSSTSIAALIRKPFFVSSTMHLNALFRKFKQQKIHMAIVKTPEGEISGVVTMSDVLDALFEDLFTEDDSEDSETL